MVSPVFGFLPARAALLLTEKVPNPTNVSESPFLSAPEIESIIASNARPAAAFEISADSAMLSISSCLFNAHPSFVICFTAFHPASTFIARHFRGVKTRKTGETLWKKQPNPAQQGFISSDFGRLPMHPGWVLRECPGSLSAFFR